jgi:hypothetical protein
MPLESGRLNSAFIIKLENAEKSPAIMPLPIHAAISIQSRSPGSFSMTPNAKISDRRRLAIFLHKQKK